jgi:phospholipid/cholesterol/gamma-HCH transport system permease protein
MPGTASIEAELAGGRVQSVNLDSTTLGRWDSGLVAFVVRLQELCAQHGVPLEAATLPPGVRRLIELSQAVPEKTDARRPAVGRNLLHRLGLVGQAAWAGNREMLTFLGETAIAAARLARGRAQFRWPDAWLVIQQCGPQALGIVALINFLVGMILAFVGAVQLEQFGATLFVADLVAIATVREMGCLMTGIILCGRTGAAFAAQLGTMKVNEEIDAFRTFGISPVEFLVLPRVLALVLMMPLLCVFADFIAIAGGYAVSVAILDITSVQYLDRTIAAVTPANFLLGIFKGGCFGVLVALTGCLRGMQCGSNAAAVGQATTSAVVSGITAIIAADGVFAVLCNALRL